MGLGLLKPYNLSKNGEEKIPEEMMEQQKPIYLTVIVSSFDWPHLT